MSIKTDRLVAEFDLRYNGLKSQFDTDVRRVDALFIINQAIRLVFKECVSRAEINSYYRDTLRKLEEKEVSLKIKEQTENYVISEIPEESYKILRRKVVAEKEGCGSKEFPALIYQTDDLNVGLKNSYWKPSFAWEHALADEGSKGLYVWSNNDFKILDVVVDYIKKPEEVHAPSLFDSGSYVDWNGITRKKDVDLNWDSTFIFDRIIDVSVLIADSIKGNQRDFQLNLNKIFNTDKINT